MNQYNDENSKKNSDSFPQEHYIELAGLSPFLVGRIAIFEQGSKYNVEIDIVQSESRKIHNHVKSLFDQSEPREAVDLSVHYLNEYLKSKV